MRKEKKMTEDGGQSFEFGMRNAERKKDDGRRRPEVRLQETENRMRNSECGRWKVEAESRGQDLQLIKLIG